MTKNNELKILSLRMKNYRQYYGDHKISLASDDLNINIIQGENGEGKSNILNAINYCLYLEEPHLKSKSQQMPIISTTAINEANVGDEILMEIELELENNDKKHRILRKIFAKKYELSHRDNEFIDVTQVKNLGLFPIRKYAYSPVIFNPGQHG